MSLLPKTLHVTLNHVPTTPFLALYERYADEIYSFLARFLRDTSRAEDALQETFLRVYRRFDKRDVRHERAWVYRVARHVAIDQQRRLSKHQRLVRSKAAQASKEPEEPSAGTVRRESAEAARRALDSLDPEERALLIQRFGLRLSQRELAASFACSERTVRNRLAKAAKNLAVAVAKQEGR